MGSDVVFRYFEWLTKGKDKLPHFTRHKGGDRLMLLAGLYDSVILEGNMALKFWQRLSDYPE
jgi:putative SOS response-associated peptidase YedK